MALSFIGKPISLISHSDVRYRGILAGIDPAASTIQLSNVYSMGTESRRPPSDYIPPVAEPYQYIIFKAAEVKDLSVDEPVVQQRNVHDDPAVMASAPLAANNYAPYAPPAPAAMPPQAQPQQQPPSGYIGRPPPQGQPQPQIQGAGVPHTAPHTQPAGSGQSPVPTSTSGPIPISAQYQQQPQARRPNAVQTASASLETVERALGDLRVSNGTNAAPGGHHAGGGRGGRRGGGPRAAAPNAEIKVPKTDFDFETMNAKFDKVALAAAAAPKEAAPAHSSSGAATLEGEPAGAAGKEKAPGAYNPQKSFFDTLSSNTAPEQSGRGGAARGGRGRGGGGGGGGGGRNRREEEREKNVATFGEPGGLGLMGPGAYVGGWGGYGRRGGGGRGRRGGGRGGHIPREAQQVQPTTRA
ncbi:hypothetical protein FA15DRAFT_689088 [Coprinopsis marcescibilis]|uniref:TFG box profile domain-containing protein n=1 Tax=Coprinopsis marcescibilis TaxID=230819 RepID=A0A5C3KKU7_COPMA|nr:hypothetical protein FA15DRAFT_689088 [Coprinopsis marcescibilis]